jgi:hypothetical protein
VHEIEITNGCIEQALEGGSADPLNSPSSSQTSVILARGTGPRARCDDQAYSNNEKVALPPNTAGWNEEGGGRTCAKEKVAGQQGGFGECYTEKAGDGECVGSEDGAQCGRENGCEREGKGDQIAFP